MHRFIEFRTIGEHTRAALRADGEFWLMAREGTFLVNRGSGWREATRLRLCANDRVRLGARELPAVEIYSLFGVSAAEASGPALPRSLIPGVEAPVPLVLQPGDMERHKRNPETGQIEPAGSPSP